MKNLIDHLEDISKQSKTTKLWVDCGIKPTFLLCGFFRSARENNLALHYSIAKSMLPYFPTGRSHNYARYGTFYVHYLETLSDHLAQKLMHDCALRISDGIFNSIFRDQFIEST